MVVSILTTSAGSLLAIAFALPALGLNVYGRNPVEFTLVGEAVAATLYLGGAVGTVKAWRLLAQDARRPAGPLVFGVIAAGAVASFWPAINDWEGTLLVLICFAGAFAPLAVGLLSVRLMPAGPRGLRH